MVGYRGWGRRDPHYTLCTGECTVVHYIIVLYMFVGLCCLFLYLCVFKSKPLPTVLYRTHINPSKYSPNNTVRGCVMITVERGVITLLSKSPAIASAVKLLPSQRRN